MASFRIIATVAAGLALAWSGPPLLADPGGGGAGSSVPGSSAPQYNPAADYQKGAAAFTARDYKAAAAAFRRVAAAVPKHAPAQYLLGASYIGMGDFKKATRPLEQAVKLDPTMIDAQRDLAIAYGRTGQAAKAAKQRAGLEARKAACAGACAEKARIDAALSAIDAATAGAPPQALGPSRPLTDPGSIETHYVVAVGLINEGRYEPAIATLEDAVWRAGPHPDLLTYLGFANRKLGRYDAARAWYEEVLVLAPEHLGAIEYYGELKLQLGDRAGAKRHLARLDRLCSFGCQQADELRRWLAQATQDAP